MLGVGRGAAAGVGVAIPDNAVIQYDASQETGLTDGETINKLTDRLNRDDLSGSAVFKTNQQNGLPVYDFDGTNHVFSKASSNFTNITQPFTIASVVPTIDTTSNTYWVSREASGDSLFRFGYDSTNSHYEIRADTAIEGTNDAAPRLMIGIFDGGDSELRENGTTTATGNVGSNFIESLSVGGINGSAQLNGQIAETVIYNDNISTTGDLSSEESRLSDKWGIPTA